MSDSFIYIGYCRATGERYVGRTVVGKKRWEKHYSGGRNSGAPLLQNAIKTHGVTFAVLEYCDRLEVQEKELFWMDIIRPELNLMRSSGGRVTFTDEMRARLSAGATGKKHSEATRAKMRQRRLSPEAKEALRQCCVGRVFSEEHKARISEAKKGKTIMSPEAREKLRAVNLGKKLSEETRRKMSASHTGRVRSSETRQKIADAHVGRECHWRGKTRSVETRQKMAEAARQREAAKRLVKSMQAN